MFKSTFAKYLFTFIIIILVSFLVLSGIITSMIGSYFSEEKEARLSDSIYHRIQIDLTYNSNHIEGSRLTHDETRYIFETNTVGITEKVINVDDIIETSNHFRCIDFIIDNAEKTLSENYIKELHFKWKLRN